MIVNSRKTVATTPTLLVSAAGNGVQVSIRNAGNNSIFIGASDVETTTGFELLPGEPWSGVLNVGDALYGIVAASTESAHVIEIK